MRYRFSESWLAIVLGSLVLLAAAPVVLSTLPMGGALSAWAQDNELAPPKSTDKAVTEKAPTEKAVTEKSGDEKGTTEKGSDEKVASEKTVTAQSSGETGAIEKSSGEEAVAEKNAAEKDVGEKDAAEKNATEKDVGEKDAAEKNATGEDIREKDAAEKNAAATYIGDENTTDEDFGVEAGGERGEQVRGDGLLPSNEQVRGDGSPPSKESFLAWLYRSIGLRYGVVFLIITFNAVALIVMIVLGMRRSVICPDALAAAFDAKLNEKEYQEAYELAKANRSLLGKVLAAGMSKLSDGYEASLAAMQEVGEEQNMRMEQRNGYIALIAQIGLMFGLLGTIDGIMMACDVIAHSNVTPKPSELAQGIGTTLVTTVVGLWIAIPMIAFYHIIRNRLARLVLEVGAASGNLMRRFATVQVPPEKD